MTANVVAGNKGVHGCVFYNQTLQIYITRLCISKTMLFRPTYDHMWANKEENVHNETRLLSHFAFMYFRTLSDWPCGKTVSRRYDLPQITHSVPAHSQMLCNQWMKVRSAHREEPKLVRTRPKSEQSLSKSMHFLGFVPAWHSMYRMLRSVGVQYTCAAVSYFCIGKSNKFVNCSI